MCQQLTLKRLLYPDPADEKGAKKLKKLKKKLLPELDLKMALSAFTNYVSANCVVPDSQVPNPVGNFTMGSRPL